MKTLFRKSLALRSGPCIHLLLFPIAYRWTYSAGGLLITWLSMAVLLDRFVLRFLFRAGSIGPRRELLRGSVYFLLGSAAFYLIRPGIVPLREAGYRGLIVCALCLQANLLATSMARLIPTRGIRPAVWSFLLVMVVVAAPEIVTLHPLHTVPKRTPAAFGLAFEDVHFESEDGVKLAGWIIPRPRARGNLIFCHGHGRNRGHVAGLLNTFHELGLNVLAFDFRGHGESEGHTCTLGEREVGDLVAAEAFLRARYPGQPLFLAGISMGAAVSLQALPRLPDVQGLWCEGSFGRFSHVVEYKFACLPSWVRGPLVRFYSGLSWLDCGFSIARLNPSESLESTHVPIYFLHGEDDELIPFGDAEAMYAAYQGPKWCFWIDHARHYNLRQGHREEYLARLRGFIEARLAGLPRAG